MTKGRVIGLGIGIVLIIAAFGIVLWQGASQTANNVAFAQGAATATPLPTTAPSTAPQQQQQQQQQTVGDDFWALLAAKLGVSADDLKAKALETRQAMIDAAVKDGRLTQAQADAIKKRITSNNIIAPIPLTRGAWGNSNKQGQNNSQKPGRGFGPFNHQGNGNNNNNKNNNNNNKQNPAPFGKGFGMMQGRGMMGGLEQVEAVAKALKLDAKALIEQMAQGKTLADIAQAQNVDAATVKQAIIDARIAQIDQALAYGLISQVQADQMKAQLTPDQIDLSRPLWFQSRNRQNMPKSMQMMPGFELGQAFGSGLTFAPDMTHLFGQTFGMDNQPDLSQYDVQTQ